MAKTLDKMTKAELLGHIAHLEAQLSIERKSNVRVTPQFRATSLPSLEQRKAFIRANPTLKTFSASDVASWASQQLC
jgi:hypothetical protein